ncbi:MAG: hypothetical protein RLZZ496_530, partial [Pseudomonadota bacterium]
MTAKSNSQFAAYAAPTDRSRLAFAEKGPLLFYIPNLKVAHVHAVNLHKYS